MPGTISLTQFVIAVASASFATFLGTFAVEWLKDVRVKKGLREDYKAQLGIELEQLVKLIVRLKSEYKARRFFPINVIELLANSLLRIEERLKSLTLLADSDLQKQVFETASDCRLLMVEINGTERWLLEKDIEASELDRRRKEAKEEDRPQQNIELSDMQRRLEELVKAVRA